MLCTAQFVVLIQSDQKYQKISYNLISSQKLFKTVKKNIANEFSALLKDTKTVVYTVKHLASKANMLAFNQV